MANKQILNDDQRNFLELALDILTVLVAGDIVWTMFFGQKPPVDFFHDLIAFLGTGALMWLVWKAARKNKAFG